MCMIWVNPDLFVFIICVVCVKTSTKLRNSELSLWWVRHSPGRGQFLCLQKSRFSSRFWFLKFLLSLSEEKIGERERQIEDIILMNHLYWILLWSPQFRFVSHTSDNVGAILLIYEIFLFEYCYLYFIIVYILMKQDYALVIWNDCSPMICLWYHLWPDDWWLIVRCV